MSNINNTKNILSKWNNFRLKIIIEGIIVGFFSGLLIVSYRYALEKSLSFARYIYTIQLKNVFIIPVWIIFLIMGGWIVGIIIKHEPMASGSGIPQVEGIVSGKLTMNWWKVILSKFVGGAICIGAGLSLGREGPSVQMGAAVGQGVGRILKRIKVEEKFLITSGASAGLAAAFNAPLAGVIFVLEEVHKNFSPIVMTTALAASITADFVSKHFFGLKPVFNFKDLKPIPLDSYFYIIILGIILGILGVAFNKCIFKSQEIYAKQKWLPKEARPIIAFLISGVVGLSLPEVLGGGHEIVNSLVNCSFSLKVLLILLIVKFFFTMTSFGCGVPGGIFLPLLVIGALIGIAYGDIIKILFAFDQNYINNLIILGMAGYFAAIVKSPITGCVLITEMTGSFSHLLSVSLVCLIAYITADIMKSKPIYEVLLDKFLSTSTNKFKGEEGAKVIIEIAVYMGSILDGKKIKEVQLPSECLLVSVKRGQDEIIPRGNTSICAGDYLIVLSNENNADYVREHLCSLAEKCIDL
ncbi:H(+)/Cl(-) exchange transporter ClcA [Clostridium sp. P21]|uniref:H(+)/Cl(-) exchange transporter ClcA n=1 Tax=Clostridium muellerianum TaxID=2716538 RepID=A0A7Y0EKX0_9CLOT|nr:H(+)/Cl(-) exchange transporter ClcA [Clostridium muellerianum]NMM65378.1 H(+)/Cl(-) exchange transporter ClcA [Clostridium muellerianum]